MRATRSFPCGGTALRIPGSTDTHALRSLLDKLDSADVKVDGLSTESADLDDVFLSLTSGEARRSRTERVTAQ